MPVGYEIEEDTHGNGREGGLGSRADESFRHGPLAGWASLG